MKKIVFLVGESGSGKSTMINYLVKNYPETFYYVKSTVTRDPRPGELDGVSYHFVSKKEFESRNMVQTVEFGGNYYGTEVREFLKDPPIGLIAVTPEGISDISNGLDRMGIQMEYEILFFDSSDQILRSRGVDENRILRGNIRESFKQRLSTFVGKFRIRSIFDDFNLSEDEMSNRFELYKNLFEHGI